MSNYLLTGISKGLGLQTAKTLLEAGDTVWGISRSNPDALLQLKDVYKEKLAILNYDLKETHGLAQFLKSSGIALDVPFDGFVNNAATAYDDLITNLDVEKLQNMYQVNVFSPFVIVKYIIRNMLLHKKQGSIVHISSISTHAGYKGLAMYASSKSALEAFSKSTAREWGVRGIRSNCIVAGFMETDMSTTLTAEQKNKIYQRTALKAPTDINCVAAATAFLLSEKAASITGQNIVIDSGTI